MVGHLPSNRIAPPIFSSRPAEKTNGVYPDSWCLILSLLFGVLALGILGTGSEAVGATNVEYSERPVRHIRTTIPILGTTRDDQDEPVGIVAEIELEFTQRRDHEGLDVQFQTSPGQFSPYAQQSVIQAIQRVVETARLNPDSWTVRFVLPYPGVTLYGESLSAMAALNVVALAKNEPVDEATIVTGTVTPDGLVGTVGGVPLKIVAAHQRHFRRVLIPEIPDVADGDWQTPFLMEVTPIRSIKKAYLALTNHPLQTSGDSRPLAVRLAP